jgi:hypothetical protein
MPAAGEAPLIKNWRWSLLPVFCKIILDGKEQGASEENGELGTTNCLAPK